MKEIEKMVDILKFDGAVVFPDCCITMNQNGNFAIVNNSLENGIDIDSARILSKEELLRLCQKYSIEISAMYEDLCNHKDVEDEFKKAM